MQVPLRLVALHVPEQAQLLEGLDARLSHVRSLEESGVGAWRMERLHDFIHAWLESGDRERPLEIRKGRRILAHGLVILAATPLRIHRDLRPVEASMEPC